MSDTNPPSPSLQLVDIEPTSKEVVVAPPVAGPMAGALAFLQNGGSPEQLEKMMQLQERWEAGEAKKEFTEAMAAFKQNPPTILKDKRVYYESQDKTAAVDYWHATLGGVTEAIVFGLAEHGISHRWEVEQHDGRVYVTCILTHKRGHSEATKLDGAPDASGKKSPLQQVASTITYLQRYTLLAATGLATKDMPAPDNDGRGGAGDDPEGRLQEWKDKADRAINLLALNDTRKMGAVEFKEASDVEGWNAFKAYVDSIRPAVAKREEAAKATKASKDKS